MQATLVLCCVALASADHHSDYYSHLPLPKFDPSTDGPTMKGIDVLQDVIQNHSRLPLPKFDPSTDGPTLKDIDSVQDVIKTCATKKYAQSICLASLGNALATAGKKYKQRSSGESWKNVVESKNDLNKRQGDLKELRSERDVRKRFFERCKQDQISEENTLKMKTQSLREAESASKAADEAVGNAEREVSAYARRSAAEGWNCALSLGLLCHRYLQAQNNLRSAHEAKTDADAFREAKRNEVSRASEAKAEAERETERASATADEAEYALQTQETMVSTAEGDLSVVADNAAKATSYFEEASVCEIVTAGTCGPLLMGIAIVGTAGSELLSLKESVDTTAKALTDAEASLEKVEEAFRQAVGLFLSYQPVLTNETWPDVLVLMVEQHKRIDRIGGLLKDTIAEVINADQDYDDSLWCSWGPGWGCGSRVPEQAISELNKAQTSLDSWGDALGTLKDCLDTAHLSGQVCNENTLVSIKQQKNEAFTGVCTHLKKAACEWGDSRLDPEYCSQSCSFVKELAPIEPVSVVAVGSFGKENAHVASVNLVAADIASNSCIAAKRTLDVTGSLANALVVASFSALCVFGGAAVSRQVKQVGNSVGWRLELWQQFFPALLGTVCGYFWHLDQSLLEARDYLDAASIKGDPGPVCRHILFHHDLPGWWPSPLQTYWVGFLFFIVLGMVPICWMKVPMCWMEVMRFFNYLGTVFTSRMRFNCSSLQEGLLQTRSGDGVGAAEETKNGSPCVREV